MQLEAKRNAAGQWISVTDEIKRELNELLESAIAYEPVVLAAADAADFFLAKMAESKTKPEITTIEKAKATLKAVSSSYDEKKTQLEATLERVTAMNTAVKTTISELAPDKFSARIDKFQEIRHKLEAHITRIEKLMTAVEEQKRAKLEEAKAIIMKGHRADYFNKL